MKKIVINSIVSAVGGKLIWIVLKVKFLHYKKFIIFPKDNLNYSKWGIVMLPSYLEKENLCKVVVITCNKNTEKAIRFVGLQDVKCLVLNEKSINSMMKYYALKDMSKEWTVVSVNHPYNTGAERLLNKKGITYRELVYYDVYKFSNLNIEAEIGDKLRKAEAVKVILEG